MANFYYQAVAIDPEKYINSEVKVIANCGHRHETSFAAEQCLTKHVRSCKRGLANKVDSLTGKFVFGNGPTTWEYGQVHDRSDNNVSFTQTIHGVR